MYSRSPDPVVALRRVGLRAIASRLAVHAALAESAPHSSVDTVTSAVHEHLGDGSTQTLYTTEVGLVRCIEPAIRPGQSVLRVGDNHDIVCHRCDAIADVDCVVGDTPCLMATDDSGYEVDEADAANVSRRLLSCSAS